MAIRGVLLKSLGSVNVMNTPVKSEMQRCRRNNVRRLDLFGSAVGPNFDPRTSDLDFLVEFGVSTKGEYRSTISH